MYVTRIGHTGSIFITNNIMVGGILTTIVDVPGQKKNVESSNDISNQ